MTPAKEKALAALLTHPTQKAAAEAIGIAPRTMRGYLEDPEFQQRYVAACKELVGEATRQAQKCISPALLALRAIVEDQEEPGGVRVSAARSLLEYSLRLTEIHDILTTLEAVEGV